MKKLLFILFLMPSFSLAEGPLFQHKDTYDQQEFENVYQDLRARTTKTAVASNLSYQKPRLTWRQSNNDVPNQVELTVNTGTANTTQILFPNGSLLSVTESLSATSTATYRGARTGITAVLASQPVTGGVDVGTGTRNSPYAVYGVIPTATNETTNYVLVLSTLEPVQANLALISSRFGSSSYVYLGMVKVGTDETAVSQQRGLFSLNSFVQGSDGWIFFYSTATGQTGLVVEGIEWNGQSAGTSATWAAARGMAKLQIPNCIDRVRWFGSHSASGSNGSFFANDAVRRTETVNVLSAGAVVLPSPDMNPDDGVSWNWSTATTGDLILHAWHDSCR